MLETRYPEWPAGMRMLNLFRDWHINVTPDPCQRVTTMSPVCEEGDLPELAGTTEK